MAAEALRFSQGDETWRKLRRKYTVDVPGRFSSLYWLNYELRGLGPLIPMTYHAHWAMCLFASGATGIPEIDNARVKMILVPRGVGKSALVTGGLPLQKLLRHDDYAIGIANEKQSLADQLLSSIKNEFEKNALLRALFPERVPPDFKKTTWAADKIVIPRKKDRPMGPSVLAAGTTATVTGVHMDMWLLDDIISQNAAENARAGLFTEIEATNRWVQRIEPLLTSPKQDPVLVIGCVAEDAPVLTTEGWKPIQSIEVGESVYSFDLKRREFLPQRVTGVWPQGFSETLTIKTDRHELTVTPNHPFLKCRGRRDGVGTKWVRADELKVGDRVETIATVPDSGAWSDVPGFGQADEDLLWLLGFLWGDGWVTKHVSKSRDRGTTWCVCAAMGVEKDLNERCVRLMAEKLGGRVTIRNRIARMDSARAARALEALGLLPGVRAPNKALPGWLFTLQPHEKRIFIKGLIDADGSYYEPRGKRGKVGYRLHTASKQLAEGVRLLALTCGMRPTAVWHRHRTSQPPGSPQPVESDEYLVDLRVEKTNDNLRHWRITSITKNAIQSPVYDLSVEGTENFVADGFVVHNTKWWVGDTYEWIEGTEDKPGLWGQGEKKREYTWQVTLPDGKIQTHKVYRRGELAVFKRPALDASGNSIFPEKLPVEDLLQMQQTNPVWFAGQYLLEPAAGGAGEFRESDLQEYKIENEFLRYLRKPELTPSFIPKDQLTVLISLDPAFSKKTDSARTAIPVVGLYGPKVFLLEDFAEKGMSVPDMIAKVLDLSFRWKVPNKVFLETIAGQAAIEEPLREAFRNAGLPYVQIVSIPSHKGIAKGARIRALDNVFRSGNFYHRPVDHQKFRQEYLSFPQGGLVDILDALSFQVDEWQRNARGDGSGQSERAVQQAHADAIARLRAHGARGY